MQIHKYGSKRHNREDEKMLLLFDKILGGTSEKDHSKIAVNGGQLG
jgi:hypothetical protein